MSTGIRNMEEKDKGIVTDMMRTFYASDAVLSNGSEEIFSNNIAYCLNDSPYLSGYIFEEDGTIQGYAMIAKSFSTEFGKPCIWIEDLYIREAYRGLGIGGRFLAYVKENYPEALLRLEVEKENEGAVQLYQRSGFHVLPYMEMKQYKKDMWTWFSMRANKKSNRSKILRYDLLLFYYTVFECRSPV